MAASADSRARRSSSTRATGRSARPSSAPRRSTTNSSAGWNRRASVSSDLPPREKRTRPRRDRYRYHAAVPDALTVSREAARRFLVRRHLLAPPRSLPAEPASVKTVVERLGSLQFDPLEVTGRNHDLVLAARIAGYRRAWTDALLYEERWLYEAYNKGLSLLPTAELPYYRVGWDEFRAGL